MSKNYCYSILALFILNLVLNVQISASNSFNKTDFSKYEIGIPYLQNYVRKDYGAHEQNWCVGQDENGTIYIGNNIGLLEVNGSEWELHRTPEDRRVLSLAIVNQDLIYVSLQEDFGYMKRAANGSLSYTSLLPELEEKYRDFRFIGKVRKAGDGIFFESSKYIFFYDGKFKVWAAASRFRGMDIVDNKPYTILEGVGIVSLLDNDSLQVLPNTKIFSDQYLFMLLPFDDNTLLIGDRSGEVFKYNGLKPELFFKLPEQYSFSSSSMNVTRSMPDGGVLVNAGKDGILIFDRAGELVQVLNSGTVGLNNNYVWDMFFDRNQVLWLALNNGVSSIELCSPVSMHNEFTGLDAGIHDMLRYNGKLYFATISGLYALGVDKDLLTWNNRISKIKPTNASHHTSTCWELCITKNSLLIASFGGIFELKDNKLSFLYKLKQRGSFWGCIKSNSFKDLYYFGSRSRLTLARQQTSGWDFQEIEFKDINADIRYMCETNDGTLWASTSKSGLLRIRFPDTLQAGLTPDYKLYTTNDGLVEIANTGIHTIDGETLFLSGNQILKYNEQTDKFEKYLPESYKVSEPSSIIMRMAATNAYRIICAANEQMIPEGCALGCPDDQGRYVWDKQVFYRFSNKITRSIHIDNDSIIWIANEDELIRYDLKLKPKKQSPFSALITTVKLNEDSIIYVKNKGDSQSLMLPYTQRNLKISYSAPFFIGAENTLYSSRLDGFEEKWTAWTDDIVKTYTNLDEGSYSFKLKAKNALGQISDEVRLDIRILAPWYRTWWAYLIYLLAFTGPGLLILKLRSRKLVRNSIRLEKMVHEKTGEIVQKNEQLKQQALKLEQLDQIKTRFFTNITHEFRTPLTLIKGIMDERKGEKNVLLDSEKVETVKRNADTLLRLVNNLLELSKIDACELKLNTQQADVYSFLRVVSSAFSSHAQQQSIHYSINIPNVKLSALVDIEKLEIILYNLLSNAFKNIKVKGNISFHCSFENETLLIIVQDDGKGISTEKLPHIFDRFYQGEVSRETGQKGTGIGLSLTKELIDFMNGSIEVESTFGKGSCFTVMLPLKQITSELQNTKMESDGMLHSFQIEGSQMKEQLSINTKNGESLILVIEDHIDMRRYIADIFSGEYRVILAADGKKGFSLAQKEIPDVIITDVMMPKFDGNVLCEKLRNNIHTSHIPIIMLTARADQDSRLEGLEKGADDYLTKPFDKKELILRVKNLISQRKILSEKFRKEAILGENHAVFSSLDEKFIEKIHELVDENLDGAEFGILQIQEAMGMSKTQLHRKMKALNNEAPGEFLRNYRLRKAALLLQQHSLNVTEVAYSVGFSSLSYFTKCFRKYYGVSPTDYIGKS